jgi:hypothetical protein
LRRIKLVVALAAAATLLMSASAAPAMADDFDNRFFRFNDGFFNNNNGSALDFDQDIGNTGDVTLSTKVSSSGNNSNQCVAPLQFGNTGNLQNAQGFATFGSPFFNDNNNDNNGFFHHRFFPFFDNGFNDVQFEGSTFEFSPTLTNTCDQAVQQAAAA